ncbi:mitochondrial cardiolipin hydrolase isoform X2 [Stigmatopora nigra]
MSQMSRLKVVGLGAIALTLSVELLWRLLRLLKPRTILNEVLFFPSEVVCVKHFFSPSSLNSCVCPLPHGVETSFTRLLSLLLSASSSLDLCLFSFSNMELSRAVVYLYKRKVTVRVLVDKQYSVITGSQVGALRNAGICVRSVGGYVHMHHKFALVDGQRLITGSLNWTLAAVQSNAENLLVTDEPRLVQPFIREFSRLWWENDPSLNRPSSDQNGPHCK